MKEIIIGATVFLSVLAVMISWQVWKKRSATAAWTTLCLRLGATGLLAYLAWVSLLSYDESQPDKTGSDAPRRLVVLQDKSHSMTFPVDNLTRQKVADSLWHKVQKLAENRPYVDVSRILYATNVVEDGRAHLLQPDSTNTGKALTEVLSRYGADAILVVSDGAATTGHPPRHMFNWASNRGIGIFAIGIGTANKGLCDINVTDARCQEKNPDTIQVELSGLGQVPDLTMVRMSIDGKQMASRRVMVKGKTRLTFSVPRVDDGWHEFEIEAISPENEICQVNNRRLGVFRQRAAQKILFLYSSPQMEYRHVTRFLQDIYPGRVEPASIFSETFERLDLEDYVFCIMGNVKRSRVKGDLLEAIDSGKLPTLFLAGTHLSEWSGTQEPFPIARIKRHMNVFSETGRGGKITRSAGLSDNRWRMTDFDMLPVYDLLEAMPNDTAVTLLDSFVGSEHHPLLVVDAMDKPRKFVMLTNSSWRWSLSPDSNVRSAFRAIWRRITDMAVAIDRAESPLRLAATVEEPDLASIQVRVSHETSSYTNELDDVIVYHQVAENSAKLKPRLDGNSWAISTPVPTQKPAISWLGCTARLQGQALESQRYPLVFNPDGLEYSDTLPHPEKLKALVKVPSSDFSDASAAAPLIQRVFDSLKRPPVKHQVRQRDWSKELTIALFVLLLFSIEWFLERRFKERSP